MTNLNKCTTIQKYHNLNQLFAENAVTGSVISFAVGKSVKHSDQGKTNLSVIADEIEKVGYGEITGNSSLRNLRENEAYSFFTVKG